MCFSASSEGENVRFQPCMGSIEEQTGNKYDKAKRCVVFSGRGSDLKMMLIEENIFILHQSF